MRHQLEADIPAAIRSNTGEPYYVSGLVVQSRDQEGPDFPREARQNSPPMRSLPSCRSNQAQGPTRFGEGRSARRMLRDLGAFSTRAPMSTPANALSLLRQRGHREENRLSVT